MINKRLNNEMRKIFSAYDNLNDFIFILNENLHIIYVNSGIKRFFDYEDDADISEEIKTHIHSNDMDIFKREIKACFLSNRPINNLIFNFKKNNLPIYKPLELNGNLITFHKKRYFVGIARDISNLNNRISDNTQLHNFNQKIIDIILSVTHIANRTNEIAEFYDTVGKNTSQLIGFPVTAILNENRETGGYEIASEIGFDKYSIDKDIFCKYIEPIDKNTQVTTIISNLKRCEYNSGFLKDTKLFDNFIEMFANRCISMISEPIFMDDESKGLLVVFTLSCDALFDDESIYVSLYSKAIGKESVKLKLLDELERKNKYLDSMNMKLINYSEGLEKLVEERTSEITIEKNKAEEASRMKSNFINSISHEIRTPLNAIIGFSELLQEIIDDKEALEFIDHIKVSGENLLRFFVQIIELNEIESGKIDIKKQNYVVSELITESINVINYLMKDRDVNIHFQDNQKGQIVKIDKYYFQKVLFHILKNAVKYTNDGGHVYIRYHIDFDENLLTVEIEDTGIGIDEKDFDKLFHKFATLNNPIESNYTGPGIGLAITKQILSFMNGDISFTSKKDVGSTFKIKIPI